MGDVSAGNYSMNNHTLFQQYCDYNNSDVSSVNGFINRHTFSQFDNSRTFKDMDEDVEKGDVSNEYSSMNSHNFYQLNGLK